MFGLSMGEMIMLGVIGLVFIGPKDLPVVARMIGRLLNELKNASGELTNTLIEARDETQKSLIQARDEYNKALEHASTGLDVKLHEPNATTTPTTTTPGSTTSTSSIETTPDKKDV